MVPQAQQSAHSVVCDHGIRGLDPATGACIPCRDAEVFCLGCGEAIAASEWIRNARRCEPCNDDFQQQLDIAMRMATYEARYWAAQDNADRVIAAELRAQDGGGA